MPLLLSLFGGFAKAMRDGIKSWKQFLSSMVVSAFAGVIVHLLIQDAAVNGSVKAAMVGLSGYSGVVILDVLSAWLNRSVVRAAGGAWEGEERRKSDRRGSAPQGDRLEEQHNKPDQ